MDYFALNPSEYSLAIDLLTRLIGLIYVIAYVPLLFQVRGLIGKEGILPVESFLNAVYAHYSTRSYYLVPTLFWVNASDKALLGLLITGIALGVLLMCGVWPALLLLLLYLIHLSITSAGQDFLSFGWETFLMEITFAAFLTIATVPYNFFGWLNLNFLLFRFHFRAGASKLLSRDPNWRNLSAIAYHYLSQPLPNTAAWYFHKLPLWMHQASVLFMFYVELIVPFAIFAPEEVRLFVFIQFVALQIGIWFTGNLSYLNYLTVFFCVILIGNQYLQPFYPEMQAGAETFWGWNLIISLAGAGLLALQVMSLIETYWPHRSLRRILSKFDPFHLVYRHGIFAIMTTERYEIVVEGSQDGEHWLEYQFYSKPGDLSVRPKRIAPYQPRLDWQAWFLPFSNFNETRWFQNFLVKLLEGTPSVAKLLKFNPFPDQPPRYVRALVYLYEFTDKKEREKSGLWWKRRLVGSYAPAICLPSKEKKL